MPNFWMASAMVGVLALFAGFLVGWFFGGRNTARDTALKDEALNDLGIVRREYAELSKEHNLLNSEYGEAKARAEHSAELSRSLYQEKEKYNHLNAKFAALEAHSKEREAGLTVQIAQIQQMRESLEKEFSLLAEKALSASRDNFLTLANETFSKHRESTAKDLGENKEQLVQLMAPMGITLEKYQQSLAEVEAARQRDTGGLRDLISNMQTQNAALKSETQKLVHALKSQSKTRGRWGEQQLRNVLEMAGLSPHSDFRSEVSVAGDDGQLRPDVIVRLPGGRDLIIDAKVSLNAYLEAHESEEEGVRAVALAGHARSLRNHVNQLAGKSYWEQFKSADFVVMFVPGEHFLTAALEHDADLYNYAFEKRIILAAPTTLIALARTVSLQWRQEKMAENAKQVQILGSELYKRMRKMGEHLDDVSRHLGKTVESYNRFVGSMESSVLPQARRFAELEVVSDAKPIELVAPVDTMPRHTASRDFSGEDEGSRVEPQRQLQ